jgi:hypothetical protein
MEQVKILSFNFKNFTNNFFLIDQIITNNIDICFLTETWLAEEENNYILDKFEQNFNISNQNEMSIAKKTRGRPFGGKSWLINKKYNVSKNEFINYDIS